MFPPGSAIGISPAVKLRRGWSQNPQGDRRERLLFGFSGRQAKAPGERWLDRLEDRSVGCVVVEVMMMTSRALSSGAACGRRRREVA